MVDLTINRNLVPARYTKQFQIRVAPEMGDRVQEACRKRVLHRSEWLREAIDEKLDREGVER